MKLNSAFFISTALFSIFAFGSFTNEKTVNDRLKDHRVFSCDTTEDRPLRVMVNDEYSIELAHHMKKADDLNDDASLEYSDIVEELYIIVIDESASEFRETFRNEKGWDNNLTLAENYRKVQMKSMSESIKMKGKPTIQKTTFSKIPAEIVDFSGNVKGIDFPIFYKIGFIEGSNGKLYMIMSWTLNSMRSKHNAEMTTMLKSFRTEN